MDRDDRLTELKKLGNIHGYTTSSETIFSEWQGRVSALLSYDPIAKHKFDRYCDFILDDHQFGRGMISHETVEIKKKIHALIDRVTADLEINRPDIPFTPPQDFTMPKTVEIPDTSAPEYPELDITRDPVEVSVPFKDQSMTKEEGLLWFWHHCHYSIKWKVLYLGLPLLIFVFYLGWKANKYSFFQKVGSAFHEVYYGEASADDKDESAKETPKQP